MLTSCLLLAAAVSVAPRGGQVPSHVDVDCDSPGSLKRVLAMARRLGPLDISLHGVCQGNFVIATEGITLRAATPGSGLAAPPGPAGLEPVLEVVDAHVSLRGIVVLPDRVGVVVRGWDADALLHQVDVRDPQGEDALCVYVTRGAQAHLIDTTLRDGLVGIGVQDDASANLQNTTVTNQDIGVSVFGESVAALNDTTIENSRTGGLNVGERSDVNILGGTFRNNGQVHINTGEWSSVQLLSGPVIGEEGDPTPYALSAIRQATIASFSVPVIRGAVSALIGASIRLGDTLVEGDVFVAQFANVFVRNAEISGTVSCQDGADAICRQTTTGGAFDCPSQSCGAAPSGSAARAPGIPERPDLPALRFPSPTGGRRDHGRGGPSLD